MSIRSSYLGRDRTSSVNDVIAGQETSKVLFTVPFERGPLFVPRESIFATLRDRLKGNHRAVLHGLGGIG